jgi:WD40 repeat protein
MNLSGDYFDACRTVSLKSFVGKTITTWLSSKVNLVFRILFVGIVSCLITASICSAGGLLLTQTATIELPVNARTLAWHPDSTTLAAGGWSGMLTVWDARTGKLVRDLKQPNNATMGEIQYSSDGKFLAVGKLRAGNKQAYLSILDASSFQIIDKLESPKMLEGERGNSSLASLSIDPTTSKRIVLSSYVSGKDPIVFTIGESKNKLIQTSIESGNLVQKVSFSPTGKTIAVGRLNSVVYFYSASDGQLVNSFSAFDDVWSIQALIFAPDGKFIFTASNTGAGRGWLDRTTGKWINRKNSEPIKMFDVQSKNLVRTFDTRERGIESLDVSSDGRLLFAGLTKGYVDIWNISSGELVKRFQPSRNSTIVKLSPDGTHLATSDTGSTEVKIWVITEQ